MKYVLLQRQVLLRTPLYATPFPRHGRIPANLQRHVQAVVAPGNFDEADGAGKLCGQLARGVDWHLWLMERRTVRWVGVFCQQRWLSRHTQLQSSPVIPTPAFTHTHHVVVGPVQANHRLVAHGVKEGAREAGARPEEAVEA